MPLINDKSIERIALSVIDRTLPKSEWTHAAHLAAALWIVKQRPDLATADAFRSIITSYNEATDTPNTDVSGYHHTITIASLRAASNFSTVYDIETPISTILADLLASPFGHSNWILSYWRRETLFTAEARRNWVEPDIAALPF